MKRVDIKNPYLYLNSAITLCYFTLAVFLFDGLAHFVVGTSISISLVWYYYSDWMKRPQVHLLPLWSILSVWFCVGEFENAVFASSSSIAIRDFLWMVTVCASYVEKIFEKSPLFFRIGWGTFLASGVALSTTDSLARRMGMLTMSYKVSICICMYVACELRSNLKKNKTTDNTKFNIFQSSWVLFCWNSISILAMIQLVYLVYDVVSLSSENRQHFTEILTEPPQQVSSTQTSLSPFTVATEYKPVMREYTPEPSDFSNPSTPYGIPAAYANMRQPSMSFRSGRQVYGRAAYMFPTEHYDANEE